MIDEVFLVAAVNIKKKYYDLTGNLKDYEQRMQVTKSKLDKAIEDIEKIDAEVKSRKTDGSKDLMAELLSVLENIDNEGRAIENFMDPINKGIEKLAVEEQELYRRICEKHPSLSEAQIVESVKERLKKENLL
jgi:cell division protein ZapA (FtsZ GTPase activity inhibitor)